MSLVEIERKWLLEGWPPLGAPEAVLWMEQGYLSFEPAVRIRREATQGGETQYRLAVKGGEGLVRTEVELPLSEAQYTALRPLAGTMAHKEQRRHRLPGGELLEVNLVDEGEPGAFWYAEVEFESEAAAQAFTPPAWLTREVTSQPGHSMAAYLRRKAGK